MFGYDGKPEKMQFQIERQNSIMRRVLVGIAQLFGTKASHWIHSSLDYAESACTSNLTVEANSLAQDMS